MINDLRRHLFQPPQTGLVPTPPVQTKPQFLPFLNLSWEAFEYLCMRIAERIDGAIDFGIYGERGQKQDGIDVYGITSDTRASVYQSRRIKSLTAAGLKKAVRDFATGRRPFDPTRFVLFIASTVRSTTVLDALLECRHEYPELTIELYHRDRLSSFLRTQPDLVESFFGPAWREQFCAVAYRLQPSISARESSDISPDTLLRGPIMALGLADLEAQADALEHPHDAVEILERIARRLGDAGFGFHARQIRERQARILADAGVIEEAYEIWLREVTTDLESGADLLAPTCMHLLKAHHDSVGSPQALRFDIIEALDQWYEDPERSVATIKKALEELHLLGDVWVSIFAVRLGEYLLIDQQLDANSTEELQRWLNAEDSIELDEVFARKRLLLAEIKEDWDQLLKEAATGRLGPADAGLVYARRGRYLALSGQPGEAIDAYRSAISQLTNAKLLGDAASALLAIANIHFRYGTNMQEGVESHRLARTIAKGSKRTGRGRDARGAGLGAFHNEKYPDAHKNLRRYLWEIMVTGDLTAELEARKLLGDLYARVDEPVLAVTNYILAGEAKQVASMAQAVDQPLPIQEFLDSAAPWQIAASLAAIAPHGDQIPDEDVEQLLPRLLELTHGIDWSQPSRAIIMEAWKAIASVTFQLSAGRAIDVLDRLEPLILREPDRARPMDDSLVEILIRLHRSKPPLRQRIGDCLIGLLGQKSLGLPVGTWAQLRSFASKAFGEDRELRLRMVQIATEASPLVLEMLAFADVGHAAVLEEAEKRASKILDMDPDPHQQSWGLFSNLDVAAVFVTLLPPDQQEAVARHLVTIAAQRKYPEEYRASALRGIANLAYRLPRDVREELFNAVFRLTDPSLPVSDIDQLSRSSLHLLSRFRFDFGSGMLPQSAIFCGARLATRQEHAQQVVGLANDMLLKRENNAVSAACVALLNLDDVLRPNFDVRTLVEHPSAHVRRMATTIWAEAPCSVPEIGAIVALDPDTSVRLRVAGSLKEIGKHAPEQRDALREVLLTDRSAIVRLEALMS